MKKILPLSATTINELGTASRSAIEKALAGLRIPFSRQKLLSSDNRYRISCEQKVEKDTYPLGPRKSRQLASYIASSALLHCSDGWGYLGNALHAFLRGGSGVAKHLAYYAELRAAMSILASEGIGVFNRDHAVVSQNNGCQRISGRRPTHQAAWQYFKTWCGVPSAGDTLSRAIQPCGIPLNEWVKALAPGVSPRQLSRRWLPLWGLDIEKVARDQDRRNEASYRPCIREKPQATESNAAVSFVAGLWKLLEPAGKSDCFSQIDIFLLRRSLEGVYQNAIPGRTRSNDDFRRRIQKVLDDVQPNKLPGVSWADFLTRQELPSDPELITRAFTESKAGSYSSEVEVLSRAILLLRVASGSCAALLRTAAFGKAHCKFWIDLLGQDAALWGPGNDPDSLSDLWADIENAAQSFPAPSAFGSRAQMWQTSSSELGVLCETERAFLWGLGL